MHVTDGIVLNFCDREAVIKHSLVHKVFLDFFLFALPKQRSVSFVNFLYQSCLKIE